MPRRNIHTTFEAQLCRETNLYVLSVWKLSPLQYVPTGQTDLLAQVHKLHV